MIKEAIIFIIIEFVVAMILALIIKGSFNTDKFLRKVEYILGFVFIFGTLIFLWKVPTFDFITELFSMAFWLILVAIFFIVFIWTLGTEFGNFLESIFKRKK